MNRAFMNGDVGVEVIYCTPTVYQRTITIVSCYPTFLQHRLNLDAYTVSLFLRYQDFNVIF